MGARGSSSENSTSNPADALEDEAVGRDVESPPAMRPTPRPREEDSARIGSMLGADEITAEPDEGGMGEVDPIRDGVSPGAC